MLSKRQACLAAISLVLLTRQLPEARQAQLKVLQRQQRTQILEWQVQVLSQQSLDWRDRQRFYWELAAMWVTANQLDDKLYWAMRKPASTIKPGN